MSHKVLYAIGCCVTVVGVSGTTDFGFSNWQFWLYATISGIGMTVIKSSGRQEQQLKDNL